MDKSGRKKQISDLIESASSKKLLELRDTADELDLAIVDLLIKRFQIVEQINSIKSGLGLDVYDPEREREIIEYVREANKELSESYIRNIFHRILDESRRFQNDIEQKKRDSAGL